MNSWYIMSRIEWRKHEAKDLTREKRKLPSAAPLNIGEIITEIGNVRGIGSSKLADIQIILEKYLGAETVV